MQLHVANSWWKDDVRIVSNNQIATTTHNDTSSKSDLMLFVVS